MNCRSRKLAAAAASVPLLIAALAACGTGGSSGGQESSGGQPSQQAQSFEEYQLSFAECMREQGVDLPDPEDGTMQLDAGGDPAAFTAAAETCRGELGEPPAPDGSRITEKTDEELLAENLEIAACFRENGVEVADPEPGGGLDLPAEVPEDVFAECAPDGIVGKTVVGGN